MRLNRSAFFLYLLLSLALAACTSSDLPVLRYGTPAEAGMSADSLEAAVELYRSAVEADDLRGVVVLVARRGIVVVHEAIGWRDVEAGLPMERDSLFRMASNTKPTISTAALILAEEGRLDIGAPVGDVIPAFREGKNSDITIHHLLTHTSGFRLDVLFLSPLLEQSAEHPDAPSLQAEVPRFAEMGPEVEPGTTYSYSNPGYNTLGAVIEIVSGQLLGDFLKDRIYEPLGMYNSLNHESESDHDRMSIVYRRTRSGEWREGWSPGDPPDIPFVRASGGMISTAWDYAIFCQMYLNGGVYDGRRILSEESVTLATTPHTQELYPLEERENVGRFYGYGWNVSLDGIYSHGDSDGTWAWVDPANGIVGIVFTQSPGGDNPSSGFASLVAAAVVDPN